MFRALCESGTKEIFWTKMLLSVRKLQTEDLYVFKLHLMTL